MPRRAFTLIELLVVIALILILVAMVITVGVGLVSQSERRETESLLTMLSMAEAEAAIERGGLISFGYDGEPLCREDAPPRYRLPQIYEAGHTWSDETTAVADARFVTARYWDATGSIVRDSLASVQPHMMRTTTVEHKTGNVEATEFLDAWGFPILMIHPGRPRSGCRLIWDDDYEIDEDGTIRTPFEHRFGIAAQRQVMFVSGGPDGRFGDIEDEDDSFTQDNLYSSPPGRAPSSQP